MELFYVIISLVMDMKETNNLETTLNFNVENEDFQIFCEENFQEIKNASELMDYMTKNILYGWIDQENKIYLNTLKGFEQNYRTSSIQEILKIKVGTCIEKAKLIKYWFDTVGIENKMFCYRAFTEENGTKKIHMHCFVLFAYQGYWYHFEQANAENRGIFKYATLEEAIIQSANKFLKEYSVKQLTEIPDIPSGLTYQELNAYISSFPEYSFKENRNR